MRKARSAIETNMIIAQISDTHIALDEPDSDRRLQDFAATVADINALDPAPDLIIHTGDIVHNGRPDEYAAAVAILAKARAPVYVMVGNKDDRGNLREAFSGSPYLENGSDFIDYSIETLPVRLIALDTLSTNSNKGAFCQARLDKLNALIDADTSKPIAVFTHHPPFEVTVGPDLVHFEERETMEALSSAIQRSGRVTAVFCGHVHRQYISHVGTIPATVMTCVATPLRKGDYPAEMQDRPAYMLHRFEADGSAASETRIAAPADAAASAPARVLPADLGAVGA